jgi:hypothetical protein
MANVILEVDKGHVLLLVGVLEHAINVGENNLRDDQAKYENAGWATLPPGVRDSWAQTGFDLAVLRSYVHDLKLKTNMK